MKRLLISGTAAAAVFLGGAAFASAHPPKSAPVARRGGEIQPMTRAMVQSRVAAAFAQLDTNHDGFITKEELSAIEAQRAQKIEQRAASFDPSKIFDRLDANHDGKITTAEFDAARSRSAGGNAAKAPAAQASGFTGIFAQADANKDGVITRDEFATIGQQIKTRIERAGMSRGSMASRMFDVADLNKDGRVTLAEMQQMALARFDRLDLNHDGTVTPEERDQARKQLKTSRHPS